MGLLSCQTQMQTNASPVWISIVIPSFNQAAYLELTLKSVYACIDALQASLPAADSKKVEIWVQDGGSTDGSVAVLNREKRAGRLDFVSQKDGGQSAALNLAIRDHARGEWVGWINSDDLWHPTALVRLAQESARSPAKSWFTGHVAVIDGVGREMRRFVTFYKKRRLTKLTLNSILFENTICQMGTFFKREAFVAVGGVRESLHYTMDYDLWLNFFSRFGDPGFLDRRDTSPVGYFRMVSGTKSMDGFAKQFDEELSVALEHRKKLVGLRESGAQLAELPNEASLKWPRRKIVWSYKILRAAGL